MPTYTASLISAKTGEFDTLDTIVVSGKSVRDALDSLEAQLDTEIRSSKKDYYKLARSNSILYLERYSPNPPKLEDFQNLPEPAPPYNPQEHKTEAKSYWQVSILDIGLEGYFLSEKAQLKATSRVGAFRIISKASRGRWKPRADCWMDKDYKLLYIEKELVVKPSLPLLTYSLELFQASHPVVTYSLKAHNPWHAAVILGSTLGIEFENRRYLDVTDRFDAEDGTYCLVHSRNFLCQFSI